MYFFISCLCLYFERHSQQVFEQLLNSNAACAFVLKDIHNKKH